MEGNELFLKEDENCYECMKNYHSLMRCSNPFKSDVYKEIDRFGFNGVGNI
jgi:hypothetical protein